MPDPNFIDQPDPQIPSKAGRMMRGQSNIFVEVKQFDSFPGNARQAGKSLQQFKLGCAGGSDNPGPVILLDRLTDSLGSLLSGGTSEGKLIRECLDDHVSVGSITLEMSSWSRSRGAPGLPGFGKPGSRQKHHHHPVELCRSGGHPVLHSLLGTRRVLYGHGKLICLV